MAGPIGMDENGWVVFGRDDGSTFSAPPEMFGPGPETSMVAPDGTLPPPTVAQQESMPWESSGMVQQANDQVLQSQPPPGMFQEPAPLPQAAPVAGPAPAPQPAPTARPAPRQGLADPTATVEGYGESVDTAQQAEIGGIRGQSDAKAKGLEAEAGGLAKQARFTEQNVREENARQADERAIYDRASADTDATIARIMSDKIDPNRGATGMGGLQKAGTLISIGLSGFLAPLNGGRNPALEMFEREMERDIAAQEADMANRRAGAGMKMSQLDRMGAEFKDRRAAREVLAAKQLNVFGMDALAESKKFEGEGERARGEELAAQAFQKANDRLLNAKQWETETRNANYKTQHAMSMDKAQLRLQAQQQAEQARHNAATEKAAAAGDGPSPYYVPGINGEPISPLNDRQQMEYATKVMTNVGAVEELSNIGEDLFKDGWDTNPYSEKYAAQKAFAVNWVNATKTADGDFSAPNAADFEQRGVYDKWGPSNPLAEIRASKRSAKAIQRRALKVLGVPDDAIIKFNLGDKGDTKADGNQQGKKQEPAYFTDESTGQVTQGGKGRPATDEEVKTARERKRAFEEKEQADRERKRAQEKQPRDFKAQSAEVEERQRRARENPFLPPGQK